MVVVVVVRMMIIITMVTMTTMTMVVVVTMTMIVDENLEDDDEGSDQSCSVADLSVCLPACLPVPVSVFVCLSVCVACRFLPTKCLGLVCDYMGNAHLMDTYKGRTESL